MCKLARVSIVQEPIKQQEQSVFLGVVTDNSEHWTIPLTKPDEQGEFLQEETRAYMDSVIQSLPATERRLEQIRISQENDPVCQEIAQYCQQGWPEKSKINGPVRQMSPSIIRNIDY